MCAQTLSRLAFPWARSFLAAPARGLSNACAPLLPRMKPGLYVFIARQPAATADFDKLCRSMQYLLRKQNRLVAGPQAVRNENMADVKKAGDPA